jgi:hypothetical protein
MSSKGPRAEGLVGSLWHYWEVVLSQVTEENQVPTQCLACAHANEDVKKDKKGGPTQWEHLPEASRSGSGKAFPDQWPHSFCASHPLLSPSRSGEEKYPLVK